MRRSPSDLTLSEAFTRATHTNVLPPATPRGTEEEKQVATLTLPDGRSFELPILKGTAGPDCLDIRTLYARAGVFTFDPGHSLPFFFPPFFFIVAFALTLFISLFF